MRVIIMGCGRMGALVAEALWTRGHQVTAVDLVQESFLQLSKELREASGATLVGDASSDQVLLRAGIEDADVFVAVTSLDNRNIFAAQKAKHLFKVPKVVCRIANPTLHDLYSELGLLTISAARIGSELVLNAIEHR